MGGTTCLRDSGLIGQPLPSRQDTTKVVTRLRMYFISIQNYNIGACAVQVPRGQVVLALLTAHYPTGTVTPPSFSFLAVVLLLSLLICVAHRFSSYCLASVQVIGGIKTMNRVLKEHLAARIRHSPCLIKRVIIVIIFVAFFGLETAEHRDTGSEGSLYHAHTPCRECCRTASLVVGASRLNTPGASQLNTPTSRSPCLLS